MSAYPIFLCLAYLIVIQSAYAAYNGDAKAYLIKCVPESPTEKIYTVHLVYHTDGIIKLLAYGIPYDLSAISGNNLNVEFYRATEMRKESASTFIVGLEWMNSLPHRIYFLMDLGNDSAFKVIKADCSIDTMSG